MFILIQKCSHLSMVFGSSRPVGSCLDPTHWEELVSMPTLSCPIPVMVRPNINIKWHLNEDLHIVTLSSDSITNLRGDNVPSSVSTSMFSFHLPLPNFKCCALNCQAVWKMKNKSIFQYENSHHSRYIKWSCWKAWKKKIYY